MGGNCSDELEFTSIYMELELFLDDVAVMVVPTLGLGRAMRE